MDQKPFTIWNINWKMCAILQNACVFKNFDFCPQLDTIAAFPFHIIILTVAASTQVKLSKGEALSTRLPNRKLNWLIYFKPWNFYPIPSFICWDRFHHSRGILLWITESTTINAIIIFELLSVILRPKHSSIMIGRYYCSLFSQPSSLSDLETASESILSASIKKFVLQYKSTSARLFFCHWTYIIILSIPSCIFPQGKQTIQPIDHVYKYWTLDSSTLVPFSLLLNSLIPTEYSNHMNSPPSPSARPLRHNVWNLYSQVYVNSAWNQFQNTFLQSTYQTKSWQPINHFLRL